MASSSEMTTNHEGFLLQRTPGLILVNDTPKGRGIFTTTHIPRYTTIDISPVLIFTPEEVTKHTSNTSLAHYTFNWPSPIKSGPQSQAIALGLGSMFNHSRFRQNVVWKRDLEKEVIVYSACRDIEAGEELCITYGDNLWFRDVEGEEDEEMDSMGVEGDELGRSGLGAIELVNGDEDQVECGRNVEVNGTTS